MSYIYITVKAIESGTVPSRWKSANVCGVFKKGEKSDPSNYRPISLTCIASKILEHIVHSHVMKHFEHYNVLTDCQHGFRSKRSTELQYSLFMILPVPYNKTNLFMLLFKTFPKPLIKSLINSY